MSFFLPALSLQFCGVVHVLTYVWPPHEFHKLKFLPSGDSEVMGKSNESILVFGTSPTG